MSEHACRDVVGSARLELSEGLCLQKSHGKVWKEDTAAVSPADLCLSFVVGGKE